MKEYSWFSDKDENNTKNSLCSIQSNEAGIKSQNPETVESTSKYERPKDKRKNTRKTSTV